MDSAGRYQEHDRATNTSFTATTDAAGNAVLTLKGGDFMLEKVVAHTGDATLRLSQGKDVVTIALSQSGFQVAQRAEVGSRRPALRQTGQARQRPLDAHRLAGRPLVQAAGLRHWNSATRAKTMVRWRSARSSMAPSSSCSMAIRDAPRRLAKRITRKQRAAVRVVSAKRMPGVMVDCIGLYEVALMTAYNQFESCAIESKDYSWWSRDLVYQLCSWEWAIRSQQYIWQFIGCFMVPW